jgi:hypothetical protein
MAVWLNARCECDWITRVIDRCVIECSRDWMLVVSVIEWCSVLIEYLCVNWICSLCVIECLLCDWLLECSRTDWMLVIEVNARDWSECSWILVWLNTCVVNEYSCDWMNAVMWLNECRYVIEWMLLGDNECLCDWMNVCVIEYLCDWILVWMLIVWLNARCVIECLLCD